MSSSTPPPPPPRPCHSYHLNHARAIHGPPPPHPLPTPLSPLLDFHARLRSLEKLSASAVHSSSAPSTPIKPVQRRPSTIPQPQAGRAFWRGGIRRAAPRRATVTAGFPRVSYSVEVVGMHGAPGGSRLRGGGGGSRWKSSRQVRDGAYLEGVRRRICRGGVRGSGANKNRVGFQIVEPVTEICGLR